MVQTHPVVEEIQLHTFSVEHIFLFTFRAGTDVPAFPFCEIPTTHRTSLPHYFSNFLSGGRTDLVFTGTFRTSFILAGVNILHVFITTVYDDTLSSLSYSINLPWKFLKKHFSESSREFFNKNTPNKSSF
jgi:hypothetical protein